MSICKRNVDDSQPLNEVRIMIAHTFQDAFSAQWIKTHILNGCDRSPARSWRMNDPLSIAGHERTQGWKIWLPGVKVGFQP